MISKVCMVLLVSGVLAQANPLSTWPREADREPEFSIWEVINQILASLRGGIDGLIVTGFGMAATVVANSTGQAVEAAGNALASGAGEIAQTLFDAAAVQVETQTSQHVAANPFASIVGL